MMFSELFFVIRCFGNLERIQRVDLAEITIGRMAGSTLFLSHHAVSRNHAVVKRRAMTLLLHDLKSRNGTLLNGQPIQDVELPIGSRVSIGPYEIKVFDRIASAQADAMDDSESTRREIQSSGSRPVTEKLLRVLTPTEARVYQELQRGFTEKEVAQTLQVSIHTVHTHVRAIYSKFEVSSRGELLSRSVN